MLYQLSYWPAQTEGLTRHRGGHCQTKNCYFENDEELSSIDFDLFYLGTGTKTRIENLKNIYNRLDGKYKIKGLVTIPEYQKEHKWGDIHFSHNGVSYKENITLLKTAKCLIDIKQLFNFAASFKKNGLQRKTKTDHRNRGDTFCQQGF